MKALLFKNSVMNKIFLIPALFIEVIGMFTSCKKAEAIHWYIETNGSFVYYFMNGNKGRQFYDKKANFIYNILSYPEEFLPYAVRGRVKSTYYFDYTINRAEEIQINNKTVYIIHIEDKSGFKLLRVCDDEMEVINELNKK
jgi:hypothetical protein